MGHDLSEYVEGETLECNHKDGRPMEHLRCFGGSTACVASGAGEVGVEMFLTDVIGQEEFKGRVVFIGQTDFLCMCSLVLHRGGVARGAFEADELQVSENLVLRRCGSEGGIIEVGSGHVTPYGVAGARPWRRHRRSSRRGFGTRRLRPAVRDSQRLDSTCRVVQALLGNVRLGCRGC